MLSGISWGAADGPTFFLETATRGLLGAVHGPNQLAVSHAEVGRGGVRGHPGRTRRWGRSALLAPAVLSVPCLAAGDLSGGYVVDRWDRENGLPSSGVSAVLQTRDGYLWVGTHAGLGRFNGRAFHWVTPENTPTLKLADVRCLFEARDGALWLGTAGGGVVSLRRGQFETWTTAEGLAHDEVHAIVEDPPGRCGLARAVGQCRGGHTAGSRTSVPRRCCRED